MSFVYHEPDALESALEILHEHGGEARVLAGGTAFALLYKLGLLRPGHVIGLGRIRDLRGIERRPDGLWIGAHTTHRAIEHSHEVRSEFPVLADTFANIASVRIRSQATVGGNLCHADPAQDPPPVLMALDAVAHIAGRGGSRREMALDEFFVDYYTAAIENDEILLGITVPPPLAHTASTFLKFLPRTADDYATISVAASVTQARDGTIQRARVALGGAGSTPIRAVTLEAALTGRQLSREFIEEVSPAIENDIEPLDDIRGSASYKRAMAVVWVRRALIQVSAALEAESRR